MTQSTSQILWYFVPMIREINGTCWASILLALIHLNEAFVVRVEGFLGHVSCYKREVYNNKSDVYFVYTTVWDFFLSINYSHIKYLVNSWKKLNVFCSLLFFYIYTSYAFWENLATRSTCLLHTNIIYLPMYWGFEPRMTINAC